MAKWNIFDSEVSAMSVHLHGFGGPDKWRNFPGHKVDSYKQQALLELASRMWFEEQLKEANKKILKLETELELLYVETETELELLYEEEY